MTLVHRSRILLSSVVLLAAAAAQAQVSSINSAVYLPRMFNDVPGAVLVTVSNYPTAISFTETGVSAASGFANRDVWRFSNNGGSTAYAFNNNDFFSVSMTLNLTANPASPRKEAGFLLSTIGGDGQFIVNTDAHEVVAFGGPFPFYAFPATFDSGETITLGMRYFLGGNGKRMIIYSANGVESPAQEFTNLEQGIIDGSTLGGYFQIVNDPANANNSGSALFGTISIVVPEPGSISLLALGCLALVLRRRNVLR
jgi:hypothetical protein